MANTRAFPVHVAYNTTKLDNTIARPANKGFGVVLTHQMGNANALAVPNVSLADWLLSSVAFRIYPASTSKWFIRGVIETPGNLSNDAPVIRANLFDYSNPALGLIKTKIETATEIILCSTPDGNVHFQWVRSRSPQSTAGFATAEMTEGTYAIVAGDQHDIDVIYEGRAVFECIDDTSFVVYLPTDVALIGEVTFPVPAAP